MTLLLLHVLNHVEMYLSKSPGTLLHNLSIVLLHGSKALQEAEYNDEDKFMHVSTHSYPITRVCTARDH